jgi:hypothetical protein
LSGGFEVLVESGLLLSIGFDVSLVEPGFVSPDDDGRAMLPLDSEPLLVEVPSLCLLLLLGDDETLFVVSLLDGGCVLSSGFEAVLVVVCVVVVLVDFVSCARAPTAVSASARVVNAIVFISPLLVLGTDKRVATVYGKSNGRGHAPPGANPTAGRLRALAAGQEPNTATSS